jgi:hypothetical protein
MQASVLSQKYVGIRGPMHPNLRRCSSVEYRPVDMRPPRALHGGRLGPLGASTYFWDRTQVQMLLAVYHCERKRR